MEVPLVDVFLHVAMTTWTSEAERSTVVEDYSERHPAHHTVGWVPWQEQHYLYRRYEALENWLDSHAAGLVAVATRQSVPGLNHRLEAVSQVAVVIVVQQAESHVQSQLAVVPGLPQLVLQRTTRAVRFVQGTPHGYESKVLDLHEWQQEQEVQRE